MDVAMNWMELENYSVASEHVLFKQFRLILKNGHNLMLRSDESPPYPMLIYDILLVCIQVVVTATRFEELNHTL